MLKTIDSDKK